MQLKEKEFVEHSSGLFVSKDGEVFMDIKCRRFPTGHFTYGNTNNMGYKRVGYKGENYLVHRLVAECYLPNPDKLPSVDHINRDKTDNRVENLRWANMSVQITNQNHPKNNVRSKPVIQLTKDGQLVREWPSIKECGRNGFNSGNISACCRRKYNKYGNNVYKNHIWKFKNND